jgi:hypothetical protein
MPRPPERRGVSATPPRGAVETATIPRVASKRFAFVRRAFVVVLDACGVGALPDAADYGDAGANTLGHLAQAAGGLSLPTLGPLGLGSILEASGLLPSTPSDA